MEHKDFTAHIRTCIKRYGIKARVWKQVLCGHKVISVSVPTFESRFTSEEIYNFCMAAKSNGLTLVQGIEIDPLAQSKLTGKLQWFFYLN